MLRCSNIDQTKKEEFSILNETRDIRRVSLFREVDNGVFSQRKPGKEKSLQGNKKIKKEKNVLNEIQRNHVR